VRSIPEETPHIFIPKRWNRFFAIYVVRLVLYVGLKNICDGVGHQMVRMVPLSTPLFFGWTISLIRRVSHVRETAPFTITSLNENEARKMKKNIEDRKYGDVVSFKSRVNPVFHTKFYLKGSAFLSG
jgi:hypothetical protein